MYLVLKHKHLFSRLRSKRVLPSQLGSDPCRARQTGSIPLNDRFNKSGTFVVVLVKIGPARCCKKGNSCSIVASSDCAGSLTVEGTVINL